MSDGLCGLCGYSRESHPVRACEACGTPACATWTEKSPQREALEAGMLERAEGLERDEDDEDDDACDVCMMVHYPGAIPVEADEPLAAGWTTVFHPIGTMALSEPTELSLCCPLCTSRVREALRLPQ